MSAANSDDHRESPCPSCGAPVPWFLGGDEHCDACWREGKNLNWPALGAAAAISIAMWTCLITVMWALP